MKWSPRGWLWPPMPPEDVKPKARGKADGIDIVYEHARDLIDWQRSSWDALDGKAATIIGGVLVVLGLVLPNVHVTRFEHWLALSVLLISTTYALIAAATAYRVEKLHVGVRPADVTAAMEVSDRKGRGAIAVHLLRKWVQNEPKWIRKGALVQRALVALAVSVVPLVGLFLTGAMK